VAQPQPERPERTLRTGKGKRGLMGSPQWPDQMKIGGVDPSPNLLLDSYYISILSGILS